MRLYAGLLMLVALPTAVHADTLPQALPFTQSWTTTSQITVNDDWSGVPGMVAHRGDDITTATGANPQNLLADGATTPVNVIANAANPNTLTTGGVAEFDGIGNPSIALNGSGTADAPFVLIHLDTVGKSGITVSYNVRDLDGSADNALQPVALHFRVGGSGPFTNVPAAFVADATTAGATLVTPVSVTLPSNADNQPLVQVRMMTANAAGNDEWVGIDDIVIDGGDVTATDLSAAGTALPGTVVIGGSTTLSVTVTPATDPESTGLEVTADLSTIGGPAAQGLTEAGGNTFTTAATVAPGTGVGPTAILVTVTDDQGRTATTAIPLVVELPPPPAGHPVISQLYGGGGNQNAAFTSDYVELFNPGLDPVDVTGWSIQYASATGTFSFPNTQPLGGVIGPGEYYLVRLATGGDEGEELPPANIEGTINMSGTTGKVALVGNGEPITAGCPLNDPDIIDFVGYGGANCREGAANAPAPSNTTALLRDDGGATDTDQNAADFATGVPNPRRTAPIVEIGPFVRLTDPRFSGANAPRDGSLTVTFSEPVDVLDGWFHITCATTGSHDDSTQAGGPTTFVVTPNANFLPGETCTVTLFKDFVHDQDTDDGPTTDTLPANLTFTFVVATGAAPAYPPDVHLTMGNPTGATADPGTPNDFLMEKAEFALSYNRDRGAPNWVSWHLDDTWVGTLTRFDTFRPDPAVPPDWYRVQASDFSLSGFDRGHLVPNADRDHAASIPINQATFLMTNMLAQAPDNNQGPWANLENYLRTLLPANELYIVAGGAGTGGTGANGFATTIANGHVAVPAFTWKVALVLPKDSGDDVARVSASTRTIAVILPNIQGIRTNPNVPDDWLAYLTTVDAVESLTGYDFFANVEDTVESAIEAGVNGTNPPGVAGGTVTLDEDAAAPVNLPAVSAGGTLTYVIDTPPANGTLTGAEALRTYTPAADFFGSDSLTFHVTDGPLSSSLATVTLSVRPVNDAPVAVGDAKATTEDVALELPTADLIANDQAGPANESGQALTVTAVAAGPETHGLVNLAGGSLVYVPEADFAGVATFTYTVCDDGTSAGMPDPLCADGTVTVTVTAVNDAPVFTSVPAPAAVPELAPHTFTVAATDADGPTLAFSLVGAPAGAAIDPTTGVVTWTPSEAQGGIGAAFVFTVRVTDGTSNADATVAITVTEVNAAPTLTVPGHHVVTPGGTLAFIAVGTDTDLPAQALAYTLTGAPAGATIDRATGAFAWTPTASQTGTFTFTLGVTDGLASASADVTAEVAVASGPRDAVNGVLAAVGLLRDTTTDRSDRRALGEIIDDLEEAARSRAWRDAFHLKRHHGQEVFDDLEKAVRRLEHLQDDRGSRIPNATLQAFIDPLVSAARLLATTAIAETDDFWDRLRARHALIEGDRAAARRRFDDAVRHYGQAWRFAT